VKAWKDLPVALVAGPLMALSLAGCGAAQGLSASNVIKATTEASIMTAANRAAPKVCSKAKAGTAFATATYAFFAADQLRKTELDPQPWADMPPEAVIYQCYGNLTGSGLYVDLSGQTTIAPPLADGGKCVLTRPGQSCPIQFGSP
jgi:hypothetical protein